MLVNRVFRKHCRKLNDITNKTDVTYVAITTTYDLLSSSETISFATLSLRLYDLDNKLIGEMLNKKKITVDPNKLSYSLWELNLATLPPGIYRIDVLLDGDFV